MCTGQLNRLLAILLYCACAMASLVLDKQVEGILLASSKGAAPILLDAKAPEALHVAVNTFADDVERVVGVRPEVYTDSLPKGTASVIIVSIIGDSVQPSPEFGHQGQQHFSASNLAGKWESYEIRGRRGVAGADEAIVITGSDKRGAIFALYTLSEQMGVSPWYWWADVPVAKRSRITFPLDTVISHGEPTVKYRGFFLNDEQPVLNNWARTHFKTGKDAPPFQVGMYEKVFELVLRLKGNYLWPAMWWSMFAVDGMDVSNGLPKQPQVGPNQKLAEKMGVVMGTSHHEPMSRNQKEYTLFGEGPWDFEKNGDWLKEFWRYGAERAKDCETIYTVGMRGDGDIALDGANVKLLEHITAVQQDLIREVQGRKDISDIPQMWAMYKEVMGYFANGLNVPAEVTALLADDNWGNLVAVLPTDKKYPGGGGIYYHADYVGDPRSYKWTNTVPLAKMWEQLNVARSFNTTEIWILNVGDLKVLEIPLEFFMSIAYDSDSIPRESLRSYLGKKASRDFGIDVKDEAEVGDIMATYSILASRRKAELVDSTTFSLISFEESERVLHQWNDLKDRAQKIYDRLPDQNKSSFYQMILSPVSLNANLNRLYISAAKSNLHATQSRSSASFYAQDALDAFAEDQRLTKEYHNLEGGKWNFMLAQSHIGYQYWQGPPKNSMPPISFLSTSEPTYVKGEPINMRITVEDSMGAWPGDNKFNCPLGYNCPDPVMKPMDRYGKPRWVDVGSGGPDDFDFQATPVESWMKVSKNEGKIPSGAHEDTRVWIEVNWETVPKHAEAGHVAFTASDGTPQVVITLPLRHYSIPADFHDSAQGDGYVAIEGANYTKKIEGSGCSWEEIPYYGRSQSGMSVFPVGDYNMTAPEGPALVYDFYATDLPVEGPLEIIFHLGPALNYILGKRLAFAYQLDDGQIEVVHPVPVSKLGDLPADWEGVVSKEVREVKVEVDLKSGKEGKHSLTVYGVTSGIVIERILIDMGGISGRAPSYLGPPESVRM